jgi:hypothetical protein
MQDSDLSLHRIRPLCRCRITDYNLNVCGIGARAVKGTIISTFDNPEQERPADFAI